MNCNIIGDLLTSYVSGLCSEETRALVDAHIATCPECSAKLAELEGRVAATLRASDEGSVNVFKILKRRILRRNVLVATCAVLAVGVLALFIGVKVIEDTPIPYYDGLVKVQVNYAKYYVNGDEIAVIITDPSSTATASGNIPVLDLICTRNYYSSRSTGRVIYRDGQAVRVDYICFTENALTKQSGDEEQSEQVFRLLHGAIGDDAPTRYEVYYIADPAAAAELTDSEYDAYRHKGTLVCEGTLEPAPSTENGGSNTSFTVLQ